MDTHKLWFVSATLMLAMGCSKADGPRTAQNAGVVGQGLAPAAEAQALAAPGARSLESLTPEERSRAERLQLMCATLEAEHQAGRAYPKRSSAEYPKLVEMLKSMSSIVAQDDTKAIKRAYEKALRATNGSVMGYLTDNRLELEKKAFIGGLRMWVRYNRLHEESDEDLKHIIQDVLFVEEGSNCANYYLDNFYTNFVLALDPLGSISFGANSTPSEANTLSRTPPVPASEIAASSPVADRSGSRGSALWVTLLQWESGPVLEQVLTALDNRAKDPARGGMVIDLRHSGGASPGALTRVRKSAEQGWGKYPMIIVTDDRTRGAAAIFASDFASRPNVQVWGNSPLIYGYGRNLKQLSATLVAGCSEVSVTIGSESIQPASGDHSGDGYRLRLSDKNVHPKLDPDEVIGAAERFAQSEFNEAPTDLPPTMTVVTPGSNGAPDPATDPNAVPADPNAAPADGSAPATDSGAAPVDGSVPPPGNPAPESQAPPEQVPASAEAPPNPAAPPEATPNGNMPHSF